MISTSALYKSILADRNHSIEWRISVNGVDYGTKKIASSAGGGDSRPRITRQLFSGQGPEIGACVACRFSCALFETSANIPRMAAVKPSYRLILGSQASEWIDKGEFFIDTRAYDSATGATVLQCYDAMLKADGEGGKPYAQLTAFATWPQSQNGVVAEICMLMGVQLDPRTVIGSGAGYVVDYPNDYTMREVLGYIAAANGGCFTMSDAGKLLLVPLTGRNDAIAVGWKLSALRTPPALAAWSGVDVYYADEAAFTAGDDDGRVLVCEVPWATLATANGILTQIDGVSYQPFEAEGAIVDLAAELGDTVTLGGTGTALSGSVTGHIFTMEITCDAGARCTIAAPGDEELDHEYPYYSQVDRTLRRKVGLAVPYYGVTISREHGIEVKRSDGASEAVFNSDTFAMSALVDGVMTPKIYFDPEKGNYIFDGALGADAVFTDSLYAETGDVSELTVDRLSTSRRIRKYILGDTSDDNYIKIQDQYIQLITGTVNPTIALLCEDGSPLLTEDGKLLLEEWGDDAAPVQAVNRYGQPLYWMRQPVGHTSDGYPLDADGVQIYATTEVTDWPVYVYDYTELVKASFSFDAVGNAYIPTLQLGAGDELGRSIGYLRKNVTELALWFLTRENQQNGIFMGQYTDITGLRKPTSLDFSNWGNGSFTEILDGNVSKTYTLTINAVGRPTKITDPSGHETNISW